MRKICLAIFVVFLLALVSCGNGGESGGEVTGSFTKTVELGSPESWMAPFSIQPEVTEQHLFFAEDIEGSGLMAALSFRYEQSQGAVNCPDVTIMMGHTSVSAFATTFAANVEQGQGSLVTVHSGALSIPAGNIGNYFTIALDTPFNYNGRDNLVLQFQRTAACDSTVILDGTDAPYNDVIVHDWSSGATTGGRYHTYLNTEFHFAGGVNVLDPGGLGLSTWPFASALPRTQNLYLAEAIDGSGPVTGIGFQLSQVSTDETFTYSVTLGHTTLSALGTTYAANYNSGTPVTMANAATFTVPAGIPAGEWFWVPLPDGSFNYNGTDNLIVEVEVTAGTGTAIVRFTISDPGTRAYGFAGDSVASDVDVVGLHLKLRFKGGPVEVLTDNATPVFVPIGMFDEYKVQVLYDNTDLGTGGRVGNLGFRLADDGLAAGYGVVNLVLGHTSRSALGGTSLAANIESDFTAAFSGTIPLGSGVKAGDWVQVPLSTPFIYDPTLNLIVQWDAPPFAAGLRSMGGDTSRYTGHVQGNIGDRTSDVPDTPGDFVMDLRLILDD